RRRLELIVQLQHLSAGRRAAAARAPGPRRCADRPSERHRSLADVRPREQPLRRRHLSFESPPRIGVPPRRFTQEQPAPRRLFLCLSVLLSSTHGWLRGYAAIDSRIGGADLHAAQSDARSSPHCAGIASNAQFERIFFAIFTRARSRLHAASRRSQVLQGKRDRAPRLVTGSRARLPYLPCIAGAEDLDEGVANNTASTTADSQLRGVTIMLTKTKIALATALFAATSTAVLAQGFDPNLANRYPAYASPVAQAAQVVRPQASLQ